ncbi:MAG: hypothetical protein J3K34DRAFT_433663 [Monoraphidium minutum]|nr:MAG: hypothetical protein J3K34DRAFT_433663 [Monoraphidium minutum]
MWASLALVAALLAALAGADASYAELLGYQEGSLRTVKCKGGGYFNGIEASFANLNGFNEKVVIGIRLRCSTGKLDLEYAGEVDDGYEFGANFDTGSLLSAACPPGKGLAGIVWRRGEVQGKDDQAWRPGGMKVYCGTETLSPMTMDNHMGKTYSLREVDCSHTPNPPAATEERRVVELEVWQEVDWVGLRFLRCEPSTQAT